MQMSKRSKTEVTNFGAFGEREVIGATMESHDGEPKCLRWDTPDGGPAEASGLAPDNTSCNAKISDAILGNAFGEVMMDNVSTK